MKGTKALAIVLVIVVAVVVVGVVFQKQIGEVAGQTGGLSTVNFRINFKDGSHVDRNGTLESNPLGLSIAPLTITLRGNTQPIQSIEARIMGKLTGNDGGSWSTSTPTRIEFYKAGVSAPLISSTATYPAAGSSWPKGTAQELAKVQLTGAQLDGVVGQYGNGDGDYSVQVVGWITLNVNIRGQAQSFTATATGTMDLTYYQNIPTDFSGYIDTSYLNDYSNPYGGLHGPNSIGGP